MVHFIVDDEINPLTKEIAMKKITTLILVLLLTGTAFAYDCPYDCDCQFAYKNDSGCCESEKEKHLAAKARSAKLAEAEKKRKELQERPWIFKGYNAYGIPYSINYKILNKSERWTEITWKVCVDVPEYIAAKYPNLDYEIVLYDEEGFELRKTYCSDRKEELKEAGFIFNARTKEWGGWITTLKDGIKTIDKIKAISFHVSFEPEMRGSELLDQLEDYEEEE